MASKNVETLRSSHQAWNKRDFEGMVKDVAENVTYQEHPSGKTLKGRDAFRRNNEEWARAFSDGRITNPEYLEAGDSVIALFTGEGTNDGPFLGKPASNRRVSFPLCEVVRFDKQGRMVSGGVYYDVYTILTQLGHAQPLAAAA